MLSQLGRDDKNGELYQFYCGTRVGLKQSQLQQLLELTAANNASSSMDIQTVSDLVLDNVVANARQKFISPTSAGTTDEVTGL